jgi:hypothetical protein
MMRGDVDMKDVNHSSSLTSSLNTNHTESNKKKDKKLIEIENAMIIDL